MKYLCLEQCDKLSQLILNVSSDKVARRCSYETQAKHDSQRLHELQAYCVLPIHTISNLQPTCDVNYYKHE